MVLKIFLHRLEKHFYSGEKCDLQLNLIVFFSFFFRIFSRTKNKKKFRFVDHIRDIFGKSSFWRTCG